MSSALWIATAFHSVFSPVKAELGKAVLIVIESDIVCCVPSSTNASQDSQVSLNFAYFR